MTRVLRDTLVSARELAVTVGPFVLLAVALLAGAYYLLKPTPPKRVVLATGSDQGAYAAFGKRYQQELKRYGIEVVLRATAGSRENLRLLRDPKEDVQIAFVQGGSGESRSEVALKAGKNPDDEDTSLQSLGTDVLGVLGVQKERLDRAYMEHWAAALGVLDLLKKAFEEAGM